MTWKNDAFDADETGDRELDEALADDAKAAARQAPRPQAGRRNLTGRYRGIYARRGARRLAVEEILRRAELLPGVSRAIVCAYFEAGVPLKELAMLHHMKPLTMWRRLNHWRDTLSDPAFLLAATFRDTLPHELTVLAEMNWIKGHSLREMAQKQKTTMHRVRKQLDRARSMLFLAASRQGKAAADSIGKLL